MSSKKKSGNPAVDLLAGGSAGMMEALACHPLDTIKVRMQLRSKQSGGKPKGFVSTGINIVRKETVFGLYKGLGAVLVGITPKMAIRFSSYEEYKRLLAPSDGSALSTGRTFVAGVGAGLTEAVLVVTPTEVVKIRLQAQSHSLADPHVTPKYRNAIHCLYTVAREEGIGAMYRGVTLTAARQASNQGVNFTVYSELKKRLQEYHGDNAQLPGWQTSIIGLISGALGPLSNAPLDTIKTRMQRESGVSTESGFARFMRITRQLVREQGVSALYRGITPRIMRVAPGQAVTFTVYEYARTALEKMPVFGQTVTN